jgi:hypothetical protein
MPSIAVKDLLPELDVDQASRHIEMLHRNAAPDEWLSLVLLRHRSSQHAFTRIGDIRYVTRDDGTWGWHDSREALHDIVTDRWDLYTGCATLNAKPSKGRGARADVASVPGVWCDLDVRPGVESAFQSASEIDAYIAKLPEPTLTVASGSGGRHCYWLTTEPGSTA